MIKPNQIKAEERLEELIDVLSALAALDFSKKANMAGDDSLEDVIAQGLNMLSDEWKETIVSKKLLEASEQQQRSFISIFDRSLNEIYIFDANTLKFLYVNQGARDNIGYTTDELSKLTPLSIKPGHTQRSFNALIRPLQAGELQKQLFETHHQRKDGSLYPVEVHLQLADFGGHQAFVAIIVDTTDRIAAETQRIVTERAFNSASEGIAISDPNEKGNPIIYVNNAFCEITGYNADEVIGQNNRFLQGENTDPKTVKAIRTALKKKTQFKGEILNYKKDDTPFWNELTITPVFGSGGELLNFIGLQRDITDRKEAEEELVESEERFRMLFEQMQEGLLLSDERGKILFVNPQFCEITGYDEEELLGVNGYRLLLAPDDERIAKHNLKKRKKGHKDQYEMRIRCKNGSIKWLRFSVSPNRGSQDIFIGVMSIVRDITDQKRAEMRQTVVYNIAKTANRQSTSLHDIGKVIHEEIGSIMPASNFYLSLHDPSTDTLNFPYFVDEEIKEKRGVYKDRPWSAGLTEHILTSRQPLLLLGSALGEFLKKYEISEMVGRKPKCWMGVPLKIDGVCKGVLAVQSYDSANAYADEDITFFIYVARQIENLLERALITEQLTQKQEELLRANQELETFIYKASHDLKGPLSTTQGLINIAGNEIADPASQKYIDMIGNSVDRAQRILDDLTVITVIRQGEILREKIDLSTLANECYDTFSGGSEELQIELQITDHLKRSVISDRRLMDTILRNLIQNSMKYSRGNGIRSFVHVTLNERPNHEVEIEIEDNGEGIDEAHQKRVFEMFYRAHHESTGSGLGLYIVMNAIEKLGGTIDLESEPKKGTKVRILLPESIVEEPMGN